jgi:hypothetical protein
MPESKSELDRLVNEAIENRESKNKSQEVQKATQYQTDYIDTVLELVDDEPEEVRKEMLEKLNTDDYNIKHSNSGTRDAAKNVKNVIRSLTVKGKEIPIAGKPPRAPLGGGGKTKTPAKETRMPKLDADAKAFMEATGMSEKEVAETLGGEAPAYIRG